MAAPAAKTREQLLARRQRVSELYLECRSMAEVAGIVGVTVGTIYADIKWAREQWRTRAADAIDKHKQRELARIDHLEVEAWRAWRRSIGTHTKTTRREGTKPGDQGGAFDETSMQTEKLAGDPRFLDAISKCIEHRRRILGLDAPARNTLENPDGGPVAFVIEGVSQATWLPKQ